MVLKRKTGAAVGDGNRCDTRSYERICNDEPLVLIFEPFPSERNVHYQVDSRLHALGRKAVRSVLTPVIPSPKTRTSVSDSGILSLTTEKIAICVLIFINKERIVAAPNRDLIFTLLFLPFQDFVPTSQDYHSAASHETTKFDSASMDHHGAARGLLGAGGPENGGLSPRFSSSRRLHHPSSATPSPGAASSADNFERQFLRVLHKVYQTIEKNEMRLAEQDRRDHIRLEWQQIGLIVDRILLVCFIALTLGVTLGILFNAPHSTDFIFGEDA